MATVDGLASLAECVEEETLEEGAIYLGDRAVDGVDAVDENRLPLCGLLPQILCAVCLGVVDDQLSRVALLLLASQVPLINGLLICGGLLIGVKLGVVLARHELALSVVCTFILLLYFPLPNFYIFLLAILVA